MLRTLSLFILRTAVVFCTVMLALFIAHANESVLEKLFGLTMCGVLMLGSLWVLRLAARRAEEKIRSSEMLLSDAEQLARLGSFEWDIRANRVRCSANLARIYGMDEDASGPTYELFLERVHPKDRARVGDEFERACKERTTFEIYYRIGLSNGQERILYARGKAVVDERDDSVRLVATAQDVTDWKRAEEALGQAHAESEARVLARTAELMAVNQRLRQEINQRRRAEQAVDARARQQSAAAQFGVQALADGNLRKLSREAVTVVAQTLAVDYCEILDLQPQEGSLDRPPGAGWMEFSSALADVGPLSDGREWEPLRLGARVAASASDDPWIPPRPLDCEVRSGLSVAIESGRRRYGAVTVLCRRSLEPTADDVSFLRTIANIMATAIERDRANAARARLAALLVASPDLVAMARPDLTLSDLNPAGRKMVGMATEEELAQRSLLDHHPQWARRLILNEGLPAAVRDGVWSAETAVIGSNGREVPVYQVLIAQMNADADLEFIGTIIRDLSERKSLEREIIIASEREQQRIGQDLHDDLCQFLTGVTFRARALEQRLAEERPRDAIAIIEIQDMLDQAIVRARDLAHGLQPVQMEVGGLASALDELSINTGRVYGISCTFRSRIRKGVGDRVVATHLYRITQEATRNAIVHGRAKTIAVELVSDEERIKLTVEDDGVGMRPGALIGKGLGLQIMNHRARIIGGALTIQRREQNGTRIICSVRRGINGSGLSARAAGSGSRVALARAPR